MPRNFGLRTAENLHKVANTHFLFAHEIQQAQPRIVAESLKEPFDIEGLFRHDLMYTP